MAEPACPEHANTNAFVSGQLGSGDARRVRRHIESCAECKSIADRLGNIATVAFDSATPPPAGMTVTNPGATGDAAAASPAPRQLGRYRVIGELGAGGMGAVFAAEDQDLDRKVAIKLLHGNSASVARLLREARALAKLRHPNVITVFEVGREGKESYVVMELVEGVTLREWLRGEHALEARIAAFVDAGRGLAAAHAEGLVHRDFKPENVMVGDDGRIQVLDFGLAKEAGATDEEVGNRSSGPLDQLTQTGSVLGTPAYMAPEQFTAGTTDARTDQFAFCVALFEALHGFRPFEGMTFEELKAAVTAGRIVDRPLAAGVAPPVQAAIVRGLSSEPVARFPSMDALLAALVHASRPRGRARLLGAAAAVAAVIAAGAVWIATRPGTATPAIDPLEAVLASSNLPALVPEPAAGDPYKVTVHRLSNGLTVWISPNHKSPRIQANLVIRSGSRVETGTTGLTHAVEHLMFRGSQQIGTTDYAAEAPHLSKLRELYAARARTTSAPERAALLAQIDAETVVASRFTIASELNRTMQALGIRGFNGQSRNDYASYVADLPSNKLAQWAKLEGEHWAAPVFRAYHAETGVILDEIQRFEPQTRPYEAVYAELFRGHPYAHATSGYLDDVVAEPFTEVEQFFATWYVPNNAALMLAGDLDPAAAIATLERELTRWRPHAVPAHGHVQAALPAGPIARTIDGESPEALIGWRAPATDDPDGVAFDVMTALLGQLCRAQADRAQFRVEPQYLVDGGLLVVAVAPASGHRVEDGIAALDEVLEAIRNGRFPQETLDAVLRNEIAGLDLAHEDNPTRVQRMADVYAAGQSWSQALADNDRVGKLTRAEIVGAARKYLTANRVVVTTTGKPYEAPKVNRANISALEPSQNAQSKFVAKLLSEESVDIPPRFVAAGRDYQLHDIPSGQLLTVRDAASRTYKIQLRWEIGAQRVPLLCAAVHALSSAGIADGNAQARLDRWYARVLSVEVACSFDSVELTMAGNEATLADDWRETMAWLEGTGITPEGWRAAAASYATVRAQSNQRALAWLLALFAELGAASPAIGALSSTAIEHASSVDARAALHALLATQHLTSYVGPRTDLGLLAPAGAFLAPPAKVVRERVPAGRPRIVVLDTGPSSAPTIAIRLALGAIDRHRAAMARVYTEYVSASGGGGRLNDALRGGRSTSYEVGAQADVEHLSDAHLFVWFGAPADQLAATVELALSILRDRTVDADYFQRARRSLEQQYRADWIADTDLPSRVSSWLRAGFDGDPRQQDFDDILRASPDELAGVISDLAASPVYISIAGDLSAIDRAKLATLGTVEVVKPPALFAP